MISSLGKVSAPSRGASVSLRVHRTASGRITKTWRQRVRIDGRLTSIGLGPYPEITLAEARQKALDNSRAVLHGGDPRGRGVPTFAEAAQRTIELHRDGWKAGSPLPEQWESTFRLHAAPLLDMPVDRITSADMLGVPRTDLELEAGRRPEGPAPDLCGLPLVYRPQPPCGQPGGTGRSWRCRGRTATRRGIIARFRTRRLRRRSGRSAGSGTFTPSAVLCVEMIVLTAVRAGEARGAQWDEIDVDAGTWTIPASRMKGGRDFSVPLSTGAFGVHGRCHPNRRWCSPRRPAGSCQGTRRGACFGEPGSPRRFTGSVRARGRGWRSPAFRRRSPRLASPMCHGVRSFRRISGPTCWSGAPRSFRLGATTLTS